MALVSDDIESQAHQALTNLGRIPEAAGSSWDKVIKVNWYPGLCQEGLCRMEPYL